MKKCTKCHTEKLEQDFYTDKRTKDGLYSSCKVCHGKDRGTHNKKEYMKEYMQKYRAIEKNKERMKEYLKKYRLEYEKSKEYKRNKKAYLQKYRCTEKYKKYASDYRNTKENKEHMKEYGKKYRGTEKEIERLKKRRQIPQNRLSASVGCGIRQALKAKKAGRHWESLVGYTLEDLTKHLESKFETWMTWDNYGKWHIDHIKPQSLFKFESAEDPEFKKCWEIDNLQPLEAIANLKKGNRLYSKDNFNDQSDETKTFIGELLNK